MTGATLRTEDALAAAADWRLLGLLLERPRGETRAEIRALAAETRDPALREAAAGIATVCEGEYLALLGPGGPASPREAAYVGMQDPGWTLADIARFYDVFAFAPRTEDPPDHVSVEVAFVAYLHLKEAFALEADDAEAAETTRMARTRFVAEHLARIARPMADRLAPALGKPLTRAALLLAARVPPPPAGTTVAPHDDEGPATCGACGSVERF